MSELNEVEKGYVEELRKKVKDQLPQSYDTDYNLYRWILGAERLSKVAGNVEMAAKNLRNHLRFRKALRLDEKEVPMEENPMFVERYSPKPTIHYLPSCNDYLCWMEYGSFDTVGILHKLPTTDVVTFNFYFFDSLLKIANAREHETGRRVRMHVVMDTKGYEMNPWTILFASNGQLAQLIQLFGYEHYPELVYPYSIINTPKWLLFPLKLIKAVMPKDFNERFRFYDHRYKDALLNHMTDLELPQQLGGQNPCSEAIQPEPARRIDPSEYYQHKTAPPKSHLAHIQLHVGQRKFVSLQCEANSTLSWFFITDGDIHFGVFYTPQSAEELKSTPGKNKLDDLEMVYPYFRLGAKLVPEKGTVKCDKQGTYCVVFCNQYSWFYKRNIYMKLEVDGKTIENKSIVDSAAPL